MTGVASFGVPRCRSDHYLIIIIIKMTLYYCHKEQESKPVYRTHLL
jgi:hypothetical protein